jgi:hypothetical protein
LQVCSWSKGKLPLKGGVKGENLWVLGPPVLIPLLMI